MNQDDDYDAEFERFLQEVLYKPVATTLLLLYLNLH